MELDKYKKVGEIHKKIQEEIKEFVIPNKKLIEIVKFIEKKIVEKVFATCQEMEYSTEQVNNGIAFPVGLSLNFVAAHYTPNKNSELVYTEHDILKIDFGVHIDGHIIDGAISISHNPILQKLIDVSEKATNKAIENFKPNQSLSEIGKIIQDFVESPENNLEIKINENKIKKIKLKSLRDLCGHQIDLFKIHSGKAVPNIYFPYTGIIKEGEVYAIEPFITTGNGRKTSILPQQYNVLNHFMFNYSKFSTLEAAIKYGKSQGLKNTHIELLTYIYNKFKTLAFCPRWIKQAPNRICLSKLISTNIIKEYPPICDIPESFIAQHEKTVFVSRDGPIILN